MKSSYYFEIFGSNEFLQLNLLLLYPKNMSEPQFEPNRSRQNSDREIKTFLIAIAEEANLREQPSTNGSGREPSTNGSGREEVHQTFAPFFVKSLQTLF